MDRLINFFKVLSDDTRLRIIILLYHSELCVCQICGVTDISQPNVSKHLAKLRDMEFVRDERQGQFIYYYLSLEEPLFNEIIEKIVKDIEEYPILKSDIGKLNNIESYLDTCGK